MQQNSCTAKSRFSQLKSNVSKKRRQKQLKRLEKKDRTVAIAIESVVRSARYHNRDE